MFIYSSEIHKPHNFNNHLQFEYAFSIYQKLQKEKKGKKIKQYLEIIEITNTFVLPYHDKVELLNEKYKNSNFYLFLNLKLI